VPSASGFWLYLFASCCQCGGRFACELFYHSLLPSIIVVFFRWAVSDPSCRTWPNYGQLWNDCAIRKTFKLLGPNIILGCILLNGCLVADWLCSSGITKIGGAYSRSVEAIRNRGRRFGWETIRLPVRYGLARRHGPVEAPRSSASKAFRSRPMASNWLS
jgi:hypothetical protein